MNTIGRVQNGLRECARVRNNGDLSAKNDIPADTVSQGIREKRKAQFRPVNLRRS